MKLRKSRRRKTTKNLNGKKFKFWKVLKFAGYSEWDHAYWLCKCKCGRIAIVRAQSVNEKAACHSCGNPNFNAPVEPKKIVQTHWCRMITRARSKNLEIKITRNQCFNLLKEQNFRCALSGVPLILAATTKEQNTGVTTASLDRIDSSKGYIKGNVQWVHKIINIMKNKLSDKEFIQFCVLVSSYNKQLYKV